MGRENGGSGENEMNLRVLKIPKIRGRRARMVNEIGKIPSWLLAYAASTVMMLFMM